MTKVDVVVHNVTIPYSPRPWQAEMHKKLKRFNVLVVHRGAGKLLALSTPIATPEGFVLMGDIGVGDTVIDRDGGSCCVTNVSTVHHLPCYEVEFSTGEKFVCHAEHEWLTQTTAEHQNEKNRLNPRNRRENPKNTNKVRGDFTGSVESSKTTIEIMETLEENYVSKDGCRQKNHRVRVVPPIQFPERDLPMHPYLLGYWLGDGTSRCPIITVGEEDRVAFLARMAGLGIEISRCKSAAQYRFGRRGEYMELLRSLNVYENKHIPRLYLRASEAQRWQLLQGLMDSDGCTDRQGRCEYTTILPALAEDVRELLCSLGIKAGMLATKICKLAGERKNDAYRIGFKGYADQPIFSLPRKRDRLLPPKMYGYQRHRMIVAVRPVASVPTRCIEVDSPTRTYCIGRSFIPTHNSVFAINELIMRALRGPQYAEYVYLLPLRNQAQRNVWLPLKRFTEPIPGVMYNNSSLEVCLPNRAKIILIGADDPDKLRGLHLHGIVLDEYADMVPRTWMTIRPMLTNHRGWVIWIGTPRGHGPFYEKFIQSQDMNWQSWYGEILPWWKTDALPREEIDQIRAEMLPEEFAQELECSFEAALVGAYYGKAMGELRAAGRVNANPLYRDDLEVHTAWDLGIRDRMAAWWFQLVGDDINFIAYEEHSNFGLPEWGDIIRMKARNNGYRYGAHIAPFDIKNREIGSGISRLESAEQCGIHFEQCPKQDVMDGIELVRRHFPRFRFHSQACSDGLEALVMYRARVDKTGQGLGPEHSVFSHACLVADTIVRTEHGDMRIADITDGMKVWTPRGLSEVLHSGLVKYVDRLVEIGLKDGRVLKCTPEHKILTNRGFLPADMIRYDDAILSGEESACRLISLFSRVIGIGYRATITGETSGDRTVPAIYTERFGKTRMVRYLKGIMSTTLTAIHSTMSFPTSGWSLPPITCDTMPFSESPTETCILHQRMPLSKQPHGTNLIKGGNGIAKTASTHGTIGNGMSAFARIRSVASTSCRLFLSAAGGATRIARLKRIELDEERVAGDLIIRDHVKSSGGHRPIDNGMSVFARIRSVASTSCRSILRKASGATRIASLKRIELDEALPVYDLTIADHGCYQANGMLVSNSDSLRYAITHIVQVLQQPAMIRMPFLGLRR